MSSIVSALTGGGDSGVNFRAKGPSEDQINQAYSNTQTGLQQQQDFLRAIQAQNGIQNQGNVFNQLQGVANGTGPNPAQAMLANATGANVANQNALMAGQRGAGANTGLIARQAAQQGSNIQQNAAGQGAALQAQQSLGALNQMGGVAGQQVAEQQGAVQGYNQAALTGQNSLLGAQSNANSTNAQIANTVAQGQNNAVAGITGGLGAAAQLIPGVGTVASKMFKAEGGEVKKEDSGPRSLVAKHFHAMAKGGLVPAMVSPGEKSLSPSDVEQVKQGANPMQVGKEIPGKPKVSGAKNSYQNDTVPMTLEEGGIILPRSVTQSKDPAKKAAEFVAAVLKRDALKKAK